MKVVVAEKPSVARDLAAVLGADTRKNGYLEGNGYQVTWTFGHLVTLKEPGDYDPGLKRWSLDTLPFIPGDFQLKPILQRGIPEQLNVIKDLIKKSGELICATDAGREGELIFRYVLKLSGEENKPFKRLWLSSLTPEAIKAGFARLAPGSDYDLLYAAARCRSESDWIVGLNATRNYTVRFRGDGVLWSVGRVQTPVLAMIARRDDEIRAFLPESYWELQTRYRKVLFSFKGDRFKKKEKAEAQLQKVEGHPFEITKVDKKKDKINPPQLFDLTELQREMNRRNGFSAADTLTAAQALYEGKFITYPRTDSRYLTKDMQAGIPKVLSNLRDLKPTEIDGLNLSALPFDSRIINDKKVSDHHAIIPTGRKPNALSPIQQKVFDAILLRLIAAFYPECLREITTVEGVSNKVPFVAKGIRVIHPGWTAVVKPLAPKAKQKKADDADEGDADEDDTSEQELPAFTLGESGPHQPTLKEGQTKPPRHFTENSLLGAMETAGRLVEEDELKEALKEKGLGTPATRASIIEVLLRRGYIQREKKALKATDLGRYLVALIQDPQLKSPELTGEWEGRLKAIERGDLQPDVFMADISRYVGELIEKSDRAAIDHQRLGSCPRCGKDIIRGNKGYGCSGWKEGCTFVIWRDYKGTTLQEGQVRDLLQRKILINPVQIPGEGEVILYLSEKGQVMDLKRPSKENQPGGPPAGKSNPGGQDGPAKKKTGAPKKQSEKSEKSEKKEDAGPQAIGLCPRCQSPVHEREKMFGCSGWQSGCKFVIWKTVAQKKIGVRVAQSLLKGKPTNVITGFKSKAGKTFDARLKLVDGEVKFDFEK